MALTGDIAPPSYKVVLLGESSVGKTSLVHRFINDSFNPHTSNTIGAAFITKIYTSRNTPDRKIKYEIWDTAGQERYRSLTPMYYRNARIALVCIDLHNITESLATARYWIEQLSVNQDDGIRILLVGNKQDLFISHNDETERKRKIRLVEEFCQANNDITFVQTSAKDGTGIIELFDTILDDVDKSFFTDYYEKMTLNEPNTQSGALGSILNSRRNEASSKCC